MNTISSMDVSRADLVSHFTRLRDMETLGGQRGNSYQPILDRLDMTAGDNACDIRCDNQAAMNASRKLGVMNFMAGGLGIVVGVALEPVLPGAGLALTLVSGAWIPATTLYSVVTHDRLARFGNAVRIGADFIAEDKRNGTLTVLAAP